MAGNRTAVISIAAREAIGLATKVYGAWLLHAIRRAMTGARLEPPTRKSGPEANHTPSFRAVYSFFDPPRHKSCADR